MTPLATELTSPIYAALSDEEAAQAIAAKRVSIRRPVETGRIKQHAIANGYYAALVLAARNSDPAAISALGWIDDPRIPTCDMDLPIVKKLIAELVVATLLTKEHAAELDAMGTVEIPWIETIGLSDALGRGLVYNARLELYPADEEVSTDA